MAKAIADKLENHLADQQSKLIEVIQAQEEICA
jgi:hypothetical protein